MVLMAYLGFWEGFGNREETILDLLGTSAFPGRKELLPDNTAGGGFTDTVPPRAQSAADAASHRDSPKFRKDAGHDTTSPASGTTPPCQFSGLFLRQ
jgi:hypothetical protein